MLFDAVSAEVRIDPKRVYATGISNGALFAERLGCDTKTIDNALQRVKRKIEKTLGEKHH